jgi:hypothetical protein
VGYRLLKLAQSFFNPKPSLFGPCLRKFISHFTEQSGDCLGLGDDWKEVRIIKPPGHYMLMQMTGNTSSGYLSLIHADVEAVTSTNFPQDRHRLLSQKSNF